MSTAPVAAKPALHSPLRHSNVAVTLHWLIVALLLTQGWLGFTFADMGRGPARAEFFTWHKTVGATILLLTLVRLGYRLMNPPPPYPPDMPRWRRTAAVWSHRLLYFLLIALPLTGLTAVSARGPTTPLVLGIPLPTVPGIDEATGDLSGEVHVLLGVDDHCPAGTARRRRALRAILRARRGRPPDAAVPRPRRRARRHRAGVRFRRRICGLTRRAALRWAAGAGPFIEHCRHRPTMCGRTAAIHDRGDIRPFEGMSDWQGVAASW